MAEEERSPRAPQLLAFFPETDYKLPIWKLPSLYQEEGRYSYHQKQRIWGQDSVQTSLIKLTRIFLVTSLPFTTPSPKPSILTFLLKFIVSLSEKHKHFLLSSRLQIFIILWRHCCVHKNSTEFAFFFSTESVFVILSFRPSQGP